MMTVELNRVRLLVGEEKMQQWLSDLNYEKTENFVTILRHLASYITLSAGGGTLALWE
jgi:hypothetical protein